MKKLVIVTLLLLVTLSVIADELEWGTGRHVAGGLFLGTVNEIATHNISFTQAHASDYAFYITFTELTVYELWSNNWKGFKFWDYTGSIFGMSISRAIWKGRKPIVYLDVNRYQYGLGFKIDL